MPSAGSATLIIRERPFRGGQRTRDSESAERSQSIYYDDLGTDERHFGSFGRCFQLPEGIDADKIEALISFGVNILELFRRAAEYVDKILRGATPADMPVESPAKFDLVINLTTARVLGVTIPPPFFCCTAYFCLWHKADIPIALTNVRFRG
jgi:hypothetical protein